MDRLSYFSILSGLLLCNFVACSKKSDASPSITLEGAQSVILEKGEDYIEAGASAVDGDGQRLRVSSFDNIDPARVGDYGITYYCEDSEGRLVTASRQVSVQGANLLLEKNAQVSQKGIGDFEAPAPVYIYDQQSHSADGSGSFKLEAQGEEAFGKALRTPNFHLEEGHHYTARAYIKMEGSARGQNLLFKISKKDDYNIFQECYWNIAEADEWEEVILPFIAPESGEYHYSFFLHKHSYSTDDQTINKARSNLAKNPVIYFDDFSIVESVEPLSSEVYTDKLAFKSSNIRIDELGNWSVLENGDWKNIFPKLTYRDWMGNFEESALRFKEYGFTGIVNLGTMQQLKTAVAQGLKYNGIQINQLKESKKVFIEKMLAAMGTQELPQTAVIMYNIDNESPFMGGHYQEKRDIANWVDLHDQDVLTKKRSRPFFVLNGVAEGLARNLKNSHGNVMDVTGSYVAQHGEATDIRYNPISTLSILRNSHRQTAPVSLMAVQSYYHATFIPMLFKGIADGARGLKFWRGGTTHNGSKKDFRQNIWAPAIKGDDGAFARIDKMLPVIREPLGVAWSATVPRNQSGFINVGLRDHDERHFLILANFSDQDQVVEVSLGGIYVIEASDFFTGEKLSEIEQGKFKFTIGHFNQGYQVIELH